MNETLRQRRKPGPKPIDDGRVILSTGVRVRPETWARIAEMVSEQDRSRATLIGDIIEDYVRKHDERGGEPGA